MNDEVEDSMDMHVRMKGKNLLIANENLIANCLSNQLLYDVEKSRCLDLGTEMSKVQNEIKHVSKLEREYLNLQLKCKQFNVQADQSLKAIQRTIDQADLEPKRQLYDNSFEQGPKRFATKRQNWSDNSLNKTKSRFGKQTAKLFANVVINGDQGRNSHLDKVNCGYNGDQQKEIALRELLPLTRLPVTCTTMSKLNDRTPKQIGDLKFQTSKFDYFSKCRTEDYLDGTPGNHFRADPDITCPCNSFTIHKQINDWEIIFHDVQ
ncbi:hypothetical protein Tco_0405488 [Tanacetum coccineum]